MSNEHKLEMADVVKAHLDVPGCPVLTSNQCHAIAMKLNALLSSAPQPPALGGEPEATAWTTTDEDGTVDATVRWDVAKHSFGEATPMISKAVHRAHVAAQQTEIERLKDQLSEVTTYRDNAVKKIERLRNELTGTEKERDQLKARCDELEGLLRSALEDSLDIEVLRMMRGSVYVNRLSDRIKAALSKPDGSEKL